MLACFIDSICAIKSLSFYQGKKKQFINKKNAVSFLLVHRSQRDPLQADEYSSKHVLLPLDDSNKALDDGNQVTVQSVFM